MDCLMPPPGELDTAVDKLQQCLDLISENIPYSVIEAVKIVGVALLQTGRITAGRSHLLLYQGLHPEGDDQVKRLISQTYMSPKVPVLLKVENAIEKVPDGEPWSEQAQQANALWCTRPVVECD